MSKAFLFGFIAGIVLIFGGNITISHTSQKDTEQLKRQEEQRQYEAEIGDATPVQLDALSVNKSLKADFYNGIIPNDSEPTITELITKYRGQKVVVGVSISARRPIEFTGSETTEEYFGKLAKESDVIILGKATDKLSQITGDKKFLYTDYTVAVTEVIKNTRQLSAGDRIIVSCFGGKILVDNVIVKADMTGKAVLPLNNQPLLLFLKYMPKTGYYNLTRRHGAFELDGSSVRSLANGFPSHLLQDESSFVKTVRLVSNN